MTRKLLFVAFLLTLALTIIATSHQLTNAAPDMAPPPQHAPSIALMTMPISPTWQVLVGGGGKDTRLLGVSIASPTDGWAVGTTGPSSYGVFMHYDGSTWSQSTAPTGTYNINAVKMVSPTEGWAVGYNSCQYCDTDLLMHYTAAGWQKAALPPRPGGGFSPDGYNGIDIQGSAGWIVGSSGNFLQFNGSSWTPITAPLNSAGAVSLVDANEAWAAGGYNFATNAFNFAHYSGGAWTLVTPTLTLPPNYYPYIYSIHMLNASEGWAVGNATLNSRVRQCLMLHYTGGNWVQVSCPANPVRLFGVRMRSSGDVWAVGRMLASPEGVIYHYNGSTWMTTTILSGTPNLNSVELVGASDGWIVGSNGTILRLVDGTWTRVQGSDLYVGPIDAVSAEEVWYGGTAGRLYEWKNGTISTHTTSITTSISQLDMISPTLGWAAGNNPIRIVHYSGTTSGTLPLSNNSVLDISALDPDHAWFGLQYNILRYTSGGLYFDPGVNSYGTSSISMVDPAHGWAFGNLVPKIITYTNGIWGEFTPTLTASGLYQNLKVIGISPSEAWVAGWSLSCDVSSCPAQAELYHFSNGSWTNMFTPTNLTGADWLAFLDISKVSATEWWAAGKLKTMQYAFLHYKDGLYTTMSAAGEDVQQVSMLPDGTGFASGVGSLLQLQVDFPYKVYLPLIRR
jgi:hypothetical protein